MKPVNLYDIQSDYILGGNCIYVFNNMERWAKEDLAKYELIICYMVPDPDLVDYLLMKWPHLEIDY